MKPTIYYCYDAYCGWCYGFSKVITQIAKEYEDRIAFDVLSGGMIDDEAPAHIGAMAGYIKEAHKNVEQLSGIKFGDDFLWHINNPEQSDWHPESTTPAIASPATAATSRSPPIPIARWIRQTGTGTSCAWNERDQALIRSAVSDVNRLYGKNLVADLAWVAVLVHFPAVVGRPAVATRHHAHFHSSVLEVAYHGHHDRCLAGAARHEISNANDRHRHALAVARRQHQPLGRILARIIAGRDFLDLQGLEAVVGGPVDLGLAEEAALGAHPRHAAGERARDQQDQRDQSPHPRGGADPPRGPELPRSLRHQ